MQMAKALRICSYLHLLPLNRNMVAAKRDAFIKECKRLEEFRVQEQIPPPCKFYGPNEQAVKVIYVDNCCSVRVKLQAIFGAEAMAKLDPFHWFKRFEPIAADANSEEAATFRGLLHRAVFVAPVEECTEKEKEVAETLHEKGKPVASQAPLVRGPCCEEVLFHDDARL